MPLLLDLDPASSSQVPRSLSVSLVYKFVKSTTNPAVKSKLNSRMDIFGASYKSDVLQDDQLKNDHPLGVPLPSLYSVELHCNV